MNDDEFFDRLEEEHEDYYLIQQEQKKKGNRMPPPRNSGSGYSEGCGTVFLIVGMIAGALDVFLVIIFAAMGRLDEIWNMQGGWFLIGFTVAVFIAAFLAGVYAVYRKTVKIRMRQSIFRKTNPLPRQLAKKIPVKTKEELLKTKFYLSAPGKDGRFVNASGIWREDGFYLLKGCPMIQEYGEKSPMYVDENHMLTEDVKFINVSTAGYCVTGDLENDAGVWKDSQNHTMESVLERYLASPDTERETDIRTLRKQLKKVEGKSFYLEWKDYHGERKATGQMTKEGFLVGVRTVIAKFHNDTIPLDILFCREVAEKNILGQLAQGVLFSDPTDAAMFISGQIMDGLTAWRDINGTTLKSLMEKGSPE